MDELQIARLIAEGVINKAGVNIVDSGYYVRFYWTFVPESFVVLISDDGNMRFFNTLEDVASFINDIGINKFDVLPEVKAIAQINHSYSCLFAQNKRRSQ